MAAAMTGGLAPRATPTGYKMGASAITVPRAVPVAVESRLPHIKVINGKNLPLRPALMLNQISPWISPVSFMSCATIPARNHAINMMETISEDIPCIRVSAHWVAFLDMRSAVRTAASVGAQNAMGMAFPETDSSMMPMNNTINGDTKPNIPPRNCILSSFVFVNITYPLLVISLLSITTLSSPKLKDRKTKFNKIISWAATIRIIIANTRMIFCKLTYKIGRCL